MIAGRRAASLRHEFRFGTRELCVFGGVILVVCALTFLFGILVGRDMSPAARLAGRGGGPGVSAPGGEASDPVEPARGDERLTFYKTLTAPTTADLPPIGKPTIEEHLVPTDAPRDEPAGDGAPAAPPARAAGAPAASAPRRVAPPAVPAAPTPQVSRPRPAPVAPRAARRPPVAVAAAPAAPAEPPTWTIQVGSLRNRLQAEDLRARLASRGLDAYLLTSATEDGLVRYRVRVGAYATRADAERVAAELRSERALSPFVTPRTR